MTIEFTDRYQALGMPLPDPATMCLGQCEGTGCVPIKKGDGDAVYRQLWQAAEEKSPSDDGWHFVECATCGGTGKAAHAPDEEYTEELTASEALYGFAGWLTSRDEKTVMSAKDDAAPIADLVKQFCESQHLSEPRDRWDTRLRDYPSGRDIDRE